MWSKPCAKATDIAAMNRNPVSAGIGTNRASRIGILPGTISAVGGIIAGPSLPDKRPS